MPPTQPTPPERLEVEGLDLLEAHRRSPSPESLAALEVFRNRSPAHEAVVCQAERFLDLSKQLYRPRRALSRALWFRLDLWCTRFAENRVAVTASLAVLAGAAVFWMFSGALVDAPPAIAEVESVAPVAEETFGTGWREQREVVLSDGSTVWLGWQSELDTELSATQRTVTLNRGIAAFRVAPDSDRPFFVNAGGVRTTVTGTEFVVNRQRAGRVEVAVLEGQVMVAMVAAPAASEATLNASQTVSVEDGGMSAVSRRSLDEIGQWRDGMLVFDDRPLLDALSELEPYTRYRLDTTEIAGYSGLVSGVFFIDQADEALVTILETHRLEIGHAAGNQLRLRFARPRRP